MPPAKVVTSDRNGGWPGQVYFVQGRCGSPVKVGFTQGDTPDALNSRLRQLQTGHPEELKVLHTIYPARQMNERAVHALLDSYRTREAGEWFDAASATAVISILRLGSPNIGKYWSHHLYRRLEDQLDLSDGDIGPVGDSEWLAELAEGLLRERLETLLFVSDLPAVPLKGWLLLQAGRDDPVGDLATDARRDERFPIEPGDPLPWMLRRGTRVSF